METPQHRSPGDAARTPTAATEIVVEVGVELGSLKLYRRRTADGWIFGRTERDQTPLLLDEAEIVHDSDTVRTWEDAVGLLDEYPWHRMYPVAVHPEFRQRVLSAVMARAAVDRGVRVDDTARWRRVCDPKADPS